MRFVTYEIEKHKAYFFHIGSLENPDSKFEKRVKEEINKAMVSFDRTEKSNHAIVITQDSDIEPGESEIPEIEAGKQYLIFALGYSPKDPESTGGDTKHKQKLLETGFTELIENINPKPKIRLVVLHDCTVSLILGKLPVDISGMSKLFGARQKSRWNIDDREYDPPWRDRGE